MVQHIESMGFRAHLSQGKERAIIGAIGNERLIEPEYFELCPGVERVVRNHSSRKNSPNWPRTFVAWPKRSGEL